MARGLHSSPSPARSRVLALVPRMLRPRVEQLGRDVDMVVAGLRGQRSPPWLERDGARYAARPTAEPRDLEAFTPSAPPTEPAEPKSTEPKSAESKSTELPVTVEFLSAELPPREVRVEAGQTLLEAGLAAGLPMPYSCAMGGCGACMVTLEAGTVTLDETHCLSPKERAMGYTLTCVGRPDGPCRLRLPDA